VKGFEIFIKKLNSLKIVKKWFKVVKIDNLIIGLLFWEIIKKYYFVILTKIYLIRPLPLVFDNSP